ncbi:ribosomal L11 methyltransferase [Hyphomicrobium denitrificans 1NES1]|uniref:Ribosomal L11 methyltransferase n=1 Tax=Hyphomicrobium denitrificans 1NES1 TaxID=670307 RepID=N0B8J7_9HYPH|nr:methyltransferase [Hyphomicrobium denitrificans]AGK59939.1 ribosomal L11 methyltransferase [Hyphomicrobium denitrificans 1NES1]
MSSERLDQADPQALAHFIEANTEMLAPPLVPEIVLHLAAESLPIWQKTEDELGEMNVPPPYWAFAWAGGQAMARYLIDTPDICRDRPVLDLGSGSGISAIAAAKVGARYVLAADIDPLALAAIELNGKANDVPIETTGDDLLAQPGPREGVVIIGDLFYERELADGVLGFIDSAKAAGCTVLIGDPQRSYFPRGRFEKLFEYQVPVTRELEDAEIKRTAVWRA